MGIINEWFLLHIWSRQRAPKMVMSYFFYNLYMQCGNNWPIGFKVEDKMTLEEGQKPMAKGNSRDSSDLKLCNFPPPKIYCKEIWH